MTMFKCQINLNTLLRAKAQFTLLLGNSSKVQKVSELGGLIMILYIVLYKDHVWRSVAAFLLYIKRISVSVYATSIAQKHS